MTVLAAAIHPNGRHRRRRHARIRGGPASPVGREALRALTMSLLGQSVLIVEDEPLTAHNIAQTFARVGAPVVVARSWHAALKAVATNTFSATILDGMTGDAELHQR